jgi:TonB family protein
MAQIKDINLAFKCTQNLKLKDHIASCSKCKNNVYDLRNYSQEQLTRLLSNSKKPVCGFFSKAQINRHFAKYAASTIIAASSLTLPTFGQNIEIHEINSVEQYLNDTFEMEDDEIFLGIIVEEQAVPVVGFEQFYKDLTREIQIPDNLSEKGRVFVQFEIDSTGNIVNLQVIKGFNELADKEAIRAIKAIKQQFIPAKQRGKTILSKLVMPIIFDPEKKDKN